VAVLGLLAVVMTLVLPKEPSKGEKVAWMTMAFVLMFLEMWAVSHDQKEQNARFAAITSGLTAAINESKATLQKARENLKSTEQVENLTQDDLENIRGGSSFAIVTPQVWSGLVPIPLTIRNFGEPTLTGVTVTIRGPEAWDFLHNPYSMYQAEAASINVGTLHKQEIKVLGEAITPTVAPTATDKIAAYQLDISAQNFTVTEYIWFRRGQRVPWDFKYTVTRQLIKSQTKTKTTFGYVTLARTNWTGN
jgi:hypothetical protein